MKIRNLLTLALLLSPTCSLAGGSYIGKLQPYIYDNYAYFLPVDSQKSNIPSCVTGGDYLRLPGGMDSTFFNAKFSVILAAWMSKQELEISGTGECTSEGHEIIRTIRPR